MSQGSASPWTLTMSPPRYAQRFETKYSIFNESPPANFGFSTPMAGSRIKQIQQDTRSTFVPPTTDSEIEIEQTRDYMETPKRRVDSIRNESKRDVPVMSSSALDSSDHVPLLNRNELMREPLKPVYNSTEESLRDESSHQYERKVISRIEHSPHIIPDENKQSPQTRSPYDIWRSQRSPNCQRTPEQVQKETSDRSVSSRPLANDLDDQRKTLQSKPYTERRSSIEQTPNNHSDRPFRGQYLFSSPPSYTRQAEKSVTRPSEEEHKTNTSSSLLTTGLTGPRAPRHSEQLPRSVSRATLPHHHENTLVTRRKISSHHYMAPTQSYQNRYRGHHERQDRSSPRLGPRKSGGVMKRVSTSTSKIPPFRTTTRIDAIEDIRKEMEPGDIFVSLAQRIRMFEETLGNGIVPKAPVHRSPVVTRPRSPVLLTQQRSFQSYRSIPNDHSDLGLPGHSQPYRASNLGSENNGTAVPSRKRRNEDQLPPSVEKRQRM